MPRSVFTLIRYRLPMTSEQLFITKDTKTTKKIQGSQ
jgi:hypothetical protein